MKSLTYKRIIVCLVTLALWLSPLMAEGISYTGYYFQDERPQQGANKVITTSFSLTKQIFALTGIFMDIELDQVTSPPLLDGTTGASRPAVKNNQEYVKNRGQIIAGVEQAFGQNTTLAANLYTSQEVDYKSNAASATLTQELFQKNFTISLSGGFNDDKVVYLFNNSLGNEDLREFSKRQKSASLTISQLLSSSTILSLTTNYFELSGKLSDPYRKIVIGNDSLAENHPSLRYRYAGTINLKQFISPVKAALLIKYRYYFDQWESSRQKGVESHTLSLKLNKYITQNLIVSPKFRYYIQDKAYFWKSFYNGSEEFFTGDYKLGDLESNSFGLTVSYYLRGIVNEKQNLLFLENANFSLQFFRYWNSNDFAANIAQSQLAFEF